LRSLDNALREARIPYTTFSHPAAFTAQRVAAVSHVPGRSWAKIVVCFVDDQLVLAVLPAHFMVDLELLRLLAGGATVRLAREPEFAGLYPDCELGAIPPCGNRFAPRVFVDKSLVGETEMVFSAGTHTEAIRLHYGDFATLVGPTVGAFGRPIAGGRR
jgi:Ala-tRNA(Pro) deacylase